MRFKHDLQEKVTSDIEALSLLSGQGLVVDVGAGYGGQIVQYLKVVDPARIFAFEPLPHNIDLLQENVTAKINFFPYACGHKNKIVKLRVPNIKPIEGRRDRDGVRADYIGTAHVPDPHVLRRLMIQIRKVLLRRREYSVSTIKVPQVRLDSILPQGRITLLKIDVQGYEEYVLRGLGNRLQDVEIAYIEYAPLRKEAAMFLCDNGFEIYDSKYIIFGPPDHEEYLRNVGFSDIFGFRNSAGKYRYDCCLTEDLFNIDVFTLQLADGFKVSETDLLCINSKLDFEISQNSR